MANRTLTLTAPEDDVDSAVRALAFAAGASIDVSYDDALILATTRLRAFLRDDLAAHARAALQVTQRQQADAFESQLQAVLDAKAETLVVEITGE